MLYEVITKIKHRECSYKHARYIYLRQSEICGQNNFAKGLVKSRGNLGLLCYQTKNIEKALDYYQQALSLAEENNYIEEQQKLLGSIGYLQFTNLNEINEAKNTFNNRITSYNVCYTKLLRSRNKCDEVSAFICRCC